ncbi:cyclin a2 [Raphanus sativus]|nr:cyclin a2 [Raphanus sativus]KAJ4869853.1 cyclin a2 [Raphanus sativus]
MFIQAARASDQAHHIEMKSLANYLAELTLVEYSFLRTQLYSTILDMRRLLLRTQYLQWRICSSNTSGSTLVAVRNKYNQEKFKRVATLTSPGSVTILFQDETWR